MNRQQKRAQKKNKGNLRRRQHSTAITMAKARWTHDAVRDLQEERQRQRDFWIACVAVSEAYGIGPKRIGIYLDKLLEVTKRWADWREGADDEYADEKIRQEMERICNVKIPFLFEDQAQQGGVSR